MNKINHNYDFLFHNMESGAFFQDRSGTFIDVNPAALKILGLTRKQLLERTSRHPDWCVIKENGSPLLPEEYPSVVALTSGKEVVDFIVGIYNPLQKDFIWASINAIPMFQKGESNPYQTFVTLHDITEKKLAEDKIRESEETFRKLTELSRIGIFLTNSEGKAIYVNPRCAEIVGVPADKSLNLNWVQYLHPDDRERVVDAWMQAVQNKDSFLLEYRYVHSEGQIIWTQCEASPVIDSKGSASLFIGSMVDITELKEAKINQELLTKRLESLWKISSLKDADLKTICDIILAEITQMTESNYGFYGFVNESETAMNIYSWSRNTMADCAVHDKPLVFDIGQSGVWGNAIRERKPFLMNDYHEACANKKGLPEGHVDLFRILAVPVFDNGRVVALGAVANKPIDYDDTDLQQLDGFLSNVQVIINQKRTEEEKIELEKQLQQAQKIESIGQLAGGIAHDFNNMLGVILGHTELALLKADPGNPFVKDLKQIQAAAKRSAELTRQLLTFARKETISPKTLDLNEAVTGMLNMLERLIWETVKLSWSPGQNLWPIRIDPAQLNQILTNLCVNARDSIESIGTINIKTRNCSLAKSDLETISNFPAGDYVCLSVADDGHGISPANLEKIFEPFFTSKELGQGTGLGLSTVYGAVKQNHGFIDVTSELGKGATFHIYFPRQQKDVETEEKAPSHVHAQGEGTILVVEDDQMLLNMTKTMLNSLGYTALAAQTSDRAIRLVQEYPGPIDLLLSDVVMPTMNGKDLQDALLKIRPRMKVIFMSGYTADIIGQQGVLEDGTYFLQKPLTCEELASKIREVLDK